VKQNYFYQLFCLWTV